MAGELIALMVALTGLAVAIVRATRASLQASFRRRRAARAARAVVGSTDGIVWCVVGIGAEDTVLHQRVRAADHRQAAEAAIREAGDLRVIGVSPVSV